MVSHKLVNHRISDSVSIINNAIIAHLKSVQLLYTSKNQALVIFLYKNGLIRN